MRVDVLPLLSLLALGCSASPADPGAARDLVPGSGEEALEWLVEGNERFVSGELRHSHEDMVRRAKLTSGQKPFGIVLGCADSRVPPEIVFDFGLGDLFVIRVAGNVVAEDEAGSIEYGIAHLDVPIVMVLGHEGCGAVTATLKSVDDELRELRLLKQHVAPALEGIDRTLPLEEQVHLGVEANVRQSVRQLVAIADREGRRPKDERALIVGAVYELDTGRVRLLDR